MQSQPSGVEDTQAPEDTLTSDTIGKLAGFQTTLVLADPLETLTEPAASCYTHGDRLLDVQRIQVPVSQRKKHIGQIWERSQLEASVFPRTRYRWR